MKYRYLAAAIILVTSMNVRGQIFDKITTSTYTARNVNPEYRIYSKQNSESASYFNSEFQPELRKQRQSFNPFLVTHRPFSHLRLNQKTYRPRSIALNILLSIQWDFLGSGHTGSPNYGIKFR